MDHYITKEGYIVKKTNMKLIEEIKKDLTVTPHLAFKHKNIKPVSFKVYEENDNYISVPKFYGIKKLGTPKIDKMEKGMDVKLEFLGDMRPIQKIL